MLDTSAISREQKKNILVRLKEVQRNGYVSPENIADIAKSLNASVSEVYGVATFYSFLSVKPVGKNVVRVCQSLPCHIKNGEAVQEKISDVLGIKPGETTADGMFTLVLTNCIGACDVGPAMLVNDDVHGNLTPDNVAGIIDSYRQVRK